MPNGGGMRAWSVQLTTDVSLRSPLPALGETAILAERAPTWSTARRTR
jgi:hypothetical protein